MAPKIAVIFYSTYGHAMTLAETAFKAVTETKAEVHQYERVLMGQTLILFS